MATQNEQQETPAVETPPKGTQPETEISTLQSEEAVENEILETPDFSDLVDYVESDGEEAPPVKTVEAKAEVPVEEAPPEVAVETEQEETSESETPEEEPKVEKKVEKAEEPAVEAAPEPEPVPEVKIPTAEELEGMYKEHREQTLPTLESLFTLTEEEAAALDEQPSKVIPKLAGQMMYDTMLSTYNAVLAAMPSVVNRLIDASQNANTAETQFFEHWPDLKDAKAQPVVSAAIRAYRSANPRAGLEDVIKNAGVMAMINLGKDPMAVRTENKPAPKAKAKAPAGPVAPRGATQMTAPKPKGGEEDNEFAALASAFLEEHG